jgi:hypothetical protein
MFDDEEKTPVEIPRPIEHHQHSWITISSHTNDTYLTEVMWCPCGIVLRRIDCLKTGYLDLTEYRPGIPHALKYKDFAVAFGLSCEGRRCGACSDCKNTKAVDSCWDEEH